MTSILHSFLVVIISLNVVRAAPELHVKYVWVVFRHGARAPDTNGAERFPNDPYLYEEFFPYGVGGLTNEGKTEEFRLGQLIQTLYKDFLGETYSPSAILSRSTDYERTKMSLQLVLAGIFPPAKPQQWNPWLNWQPAVVNYVPSDEDVLMIPEECPKYLKELKRIQALPEVQQRINEYSEFMEYLTYWTGKNISTSNDMFNLYHALMAEYSMGLELPPWTKEIFPAGWLLGGIILEYDIVSYNENLRRLNGGMLLKDMIDTMESVINGTNGKKMSLLSGHETNVAALLKTLGIYEPHVPDYGSAIIVDLLYGEGVHYVRIRYYRGIPTRYLEIPIPGCVSPCPLLKFVHLLRNVIPTGDDMNCPKKKL